MILENDHTRRRMELISVIVPVYNVEVYLSRCLESILNQTYTNLEIIVINDGSTDNSGEICDIYAKKSSQIIVIHKDNGGLSSARNIGLEKAQGEYIFFVDSDDYIAENALEVLVEQLKKHSADVAVCKYIPVDKNGNRIGKKPNEYSDELVSGKDFLVRHSMNLDEGFVVVWNKLYKRNIFENLRFDNGKIHEDEFIFHKICIKCNNIVIIGKELYYYTQREDSIMKSTKYEDRLDVLDAFISRIIYMKNTKDKDLRMACDKTLNAVYFLLLDFGQVLGFNCPKLNQQMKALRYQVFSIVPTIMSGNLWGIKEKVAFCVLLLSPKIYGNIWGIENDETV